MAEQVIGQGPLASLADAVPAVDWATLTVRLADGRTITYTVKGAAAAHVITDVSALVGNLLIFRFDGPSDLEVSGG